MDTQGSINEARLQRDLRYICIMGLEGRRRMAAQEPVEAEVLASLGYLDDEGGITPQGLEFMLASQSLSRSN